MACVSRAQSRFELATVVPRRRTPTRSPEPVHESLVPVKHKLCVVASGVGGYEAGSSTTGASASQRAISHAFVRESVAWTFGPLIVASCGPP
jgi:hypothetical protein